MTTVDFNMDTPPEQFVSASFLTITLPFAPKLFYRHGWQSWSLAAWIDVEKPIPIQKPKLLHAMQHDPNYTYHPHPNGSWVGAIEIDQGNILLLGSLGLDAHVELEDNQLRGWYESGIGEWFVGYGAEQTVFFRYAELLGQRLGKIGTKTAPRVWCSWYSLYTAVSENLIERILADLGDLPFDVLQIDDGWQIAIGDWEANAKFPSGMLRLADKIKSTGRKAGIWLAPLIAVKSSSLFREHSNWFLRDQEEKLVSAGFNWREPLYAIDTTHPEVASWLRELIKQVSQWGFDYVKLDFLYGGALPGKRSKDIPREAAYRQALKVIREALTDETFLLACGAPILPSLGLCDALRIGPDVAPEWENPRDAVLLYNPTIPGTKNAIRTSINRLWLRPLVQADSDVVYFRSTECKLTRDQKSLLQDLASVCNFKATSDLPQWLTNDERGHLKAFLESRPEVVYSSRYVFRLDDRVVNFSPAMALADPPQGIVRWESIFLSWAGNYGWVLNMMDRIQKSALLKTIRQL